MYYLETVSFLYKQCGISDFVPVMLLVIFYDIIVVIRQKPFISMYQMFLNEGPNAVALNLEAGGPWGPE